jgi:hypothetical protein
MGVMLHVSHKGRTYIKGVSGKLLARISGIKEIQQ